MHDAPSRVTIESDGSRVVVTGELDAHSAPALTEALSPLPGDGTVEVDFSGVSFMDSSGLRVLIEAHQRAGSEGRTFVVARPGATVRRLIELSGLLDHLNVTAE